MTTRIYTVAFELELLWNDSGRCAYNHDIQASEHFPIYSVRSMDGPTTLLSCPAHLPDVTVNWDKLEKSQR